MKKNTVLETTTLNEVVFVDVTNCKLHEADFSLSPQIVQLGGHPLPAMAIHPSFSRITFPQNQKEKTARGGLPFILSCHSSTIYTQTLQFVGVHEVCKKRHNPQPLPAHQGWIELSHETNKIHNRLLVTSYWLVHDRILIS